MLVIVVIVVLIYGYFYEISCVTEVHGQGSRIKEMQIGD